MNAQGHHGPVAATPRELQQVLAAERSGRAFLQWRSEGRLRVLLLGDSPRVMIGRGEECEVPLTEDPEVSRAHAVLERIGGEWTLLDDGISRNGSFVDGKRVLSRQRLADSSRLCVGSSELIYRSGAAPRAAATQSTGERPSGVYVSETQRRVLIALCRPVHESESATAATNREIGAEVNLSVDAVKAHLKAMFENFGLSELPQNEKRARLVSTALVGGVVSPREF